jgi:hypothetical protein
MTTNQRKRLLNLMGPEAPLRLRIIDSIVTLFSRTPECPRWSMGYDCKTANGMFCNDCGRGKQPA